MYLRKTWLIFYLISLYFIIQSLIYYACCVNISFVLRNIFLLLLLPLLLLCFGLGTAPKGF